MSRILIVEDEKKIARFLELELTHEGYEVQTAGDGRSGLEQAQSWQPDLLILDEPINGLDPQGIAEIRDTLKRLNQKKGITILISSHILEELYKVADTFGIINQGELILELSKEELEDISKRVKKFR